MKDERQGRNTDAVYERDSYIKEFSATVLGCVKAEKGYEVILDVTAFFPEGGGQPADKGTINDIEVLDVQNKDGEIIHYVAQEIPEGTVVVGCIDFETRMARMQMHSGEHLLCGLIHNKYGYDNVGFHLNDEAVTLDVNGVLDNEQLAEIELEANKLIYANLPIQVSFPEKEEADSMDYRSKLELMDGIRLVTIEGVDVCACCAPHVASTAEIGIIKVIDAMPHRGGTRITMLAGIKAYMDYLAINNSNKIICGQISSKRYETDTQVGALLERLKNIQAENTELKKKITEYTFAKVKEDIVNRAEGDMTPVILFLEGLDDVQFRNVINECTSIFAGLVAGFLKTETGYRYIMSTRDGRDDLPAIAKDINQKLNGRGGGSKQMVQGSVIANATLIEETIKMIS